MGFISDVFGGYKELEEDKVFFNRFIYGSLIYLSVDDKQAEIKVKSPGKNSCILFVVYEAKMSANEFKDKLEEYYATRDLMILREKMKDFIDRIRSEEKL